MSESDTVVFDLDGVVHKYSKGWHDGSLYDEPIEGAIESIKMLKEMGLNVVILTARKNIDDAKLWMKKHFDGKLEGEGLEGKIEVTNVKPSAICYVDDKGITFTNWKDTLEKIKKLVELREFGVLNEGSCLDCLDCIILEEPKVIETKMDYITLED